MPSVLGHKWHISLLIDGLYERILLIVFRSFMTFFIVLWRTGFLHLPVSGLHILSFSIHSILLYLRMLVNCVSKSGRTIFTSISLQGEGKKFKHFFLYFAHLLFWFYNTYRYSLWKALCSIVHFRVSYHSHSLVK